MTTTTRQLRALESEAASAGDAVQVAICRVALTPAGEWDGSQLADLPLTTADVLRVCRMTREEALAECAEVLAEAQAQD